MQIEPIKIDRPTIKAVEIRAESGSEYSVLSLALELVEPGDWVIYHRGRMGTVPVTMRRAAYKAYEAGGCVLTQRIVPGSGDEVRELEYIAIKSGRRAR